MPNQLTSLFEFVLQFVNSFQPGPVFMMVWDKVKSALNPDTTPQATIGKGHVKMCCQNLRAHI